MSLRRVYRLLNSYTILRQRLGSLPYFFTFAVQNITFK